MILPIANSRPAFTPLQRIVPLAVAVVIVLFTIELIRRRKLREEYAMLWLAASIVLTLFAVFPRLLFDLGLLQNV